MIATSYAVPILLVLKSTLVLLAGSAATMALRRASAGARHLAWVSAFLLLLALPLMATLLPTLEVLPRMAAPLSAVTPGGDAAATSGPRNVPETPRASGAPAATVSPAVARRLPLPLGPAALLLWGLGAALLLGRLAISTLLLRRMLREASEAAGSAWRVPLWEAADRLGLADVPRLLVSGRVAIPFTSGLLHPVIVVPALGADWTDARRRAVLFHELAHIRRRDLLGHTVARVACALYWFNPLVWSAARRLRVESERACDDLVIGVGTPPSEYADHLLQILRNVRAMGNATPAVALPMARSREFEGRMLAILDPALARQAPGRAQAAALGVSLLAATLLVAALAPAPAPPPPHLATAPAPEPLGERIAAEEAEAEYSAALQGHAPVVAPESPTAIASLAEPPLAPQAPTVTVAPRVGIDFTYLARTAMSSALASLGGKQREAPTARDVPTLARLLATDPDAGVRRTAAWGLADAPDASAPLARALREDRDPGVREMAAWALAEGDSDGQAAAPLTRALSEDTSRAVRATAAWGLGTLEVSGGGVAQALAAALGDPDAEVRGRAAWALGSLEVSPAPPALSRALSDSDPHVRLRAAWAAGQIRDRTLASVLERRVSAESDPEVRRAAVRALLRSSETSAATAELLLAFSDPEIRAQGARVAAGLDYDLDAWPWPWPQPRPFP
jgi:beta-lactamase regulating signal transducer with metallopeptidase domain/HEAT repeat protein